MFKKITISFYLLVIFILPTFVLATAKEDALNGLTATNVTPGLADTDVEVEVGRIIGVALSFVGLIFFLLVLYGGFLWMTAQGDSAKVKKGKEMIIDAVIGLVVVMSAYAITAFVGENFAK